MPTYSAFYQLADLDGHPIPKTSDFSPLRPFLPVVPPTPPDMHLEDIQSIRHPTESTLSNIPAIETVRNSLPRSSLPTKLPLQTPGPTLQTLPDDLIDAILSHLPSLLHALPLLQAAPSLLPALRPHLHSFSTHPAPMRPSPTIHVPPGALLALLPLAGRFLTLLALATTPPPTLPAILAATAAPLKTLSLRAVNPAHPLAALLHLAAPTLSTLEIFAASGTALSPAQLAHLACCTKVKSLTLHLSAFPHNWGPVWAALGPSLTDLSLGATQFWVLDADESQLLHLVAKHCPHIRRLAFYHLGPSLGPAFVQLCTRYGSQLESLHLDQCRVERPDLARLAEGNFCAEVAVTHGPDMCPKNFAGDVVELLGVRIGSLRYTALRAHDESLASVGRRCERLRELRLDFAWSLADGTLSSVLENIGARLTVLELGFLGGSRAEEGAREIMRVLGRVARRLKVFRIAARGVDVEQFGRVVRNCKAYLEEVCITFGGGKGVGEDALIGIVEAVYPCFALESLVVVERGVMSGHRKSEAGIRDACYPLRRRLAWLSICGRDFV